RGLCVVAGRVVAVGGRAVFVVAMGGRRAAGRMVAPTARGNGSALHGRDGTRAAQQQVEPSRSCRDAELTRPRRDAILLISRSATSAWPGTFYRRNESLPSDMRYFDGRPPETLRFGSPWDFVLGLWEPCGNTSPERELTHPSFLREGLSICNRSA